MTSNPASGPSVEQALMKVVSAVRALDEEGRLFVLSTLLAVQMIHSGLGWSECQEVLASSMKRATDGFLRRQRQRGQGPAGAR